MSFWMPKPDPDRLESLKSAGVTGTTAGLMAAGILGLRRVFALGIEEGLQSLFSGLGGSAFWVGVAIAALSGSVFGITYLYAIRRDRNFQINLGVIFAFALVRGLALVNVAAALSLRGWPFVTGVLESLLIFGAAAMAAEVAFRLGWIEKVAQQNN